MENPMDAIHKLCERVREEAKKLDLNPLQISVMPKNPMIPGSSDSLVVTFGLTAEAVESIEQAEQRRIDAEFEALINGNDLTKPDERTQKQIDESTEGIEDLLKRWEKGE